MLPAVSRRRAGMVLVAVALAGCSGSARQATSSSSPSQAPAPRGLVGLIDRARVVAVCEDLRQASTALDGGLPEEEVDRFVTAAAAALEQPPRLPTSLTVAAALRAGVAGADVHAGLATGLAWCRTNHG